MATYDLTLAPIPDRRQNPYISIKQRFLGTESFEIYAGYNLEVPNCWELVEASFSIVTDATVANRYLQVNKYIEPALLVSYQFQSDPIAASTSSGLVLMKTSDYSNLGLKTGLYYVPTSVGTLREKAVAIAGNNSLRFLVNTGKAGDVCTVICQLRWLNWELGLDYPEMFGKGEYPK